MYTSDHGDNLGARGLWGKSTMYEEIAGVPFLLAGPGIPKGKVVETPVSHVDAFPTILEIAGEKMPAGYPGHNLVKIAEGHKPERNVMSEYHGMGSSTGAFAVRVGKWKYVHYAKYGPQLFDLEKDPDETTDLAEDPKLAKVLEQCRSALYAICDPQDVDRRARARQAELLKLNGGREAVIKRGDFGFTPAPGTVADFK
jgi:choline-sulfatase